MTALGGVLVALGVTVVVLSALSTSLLPSLFPRLHLLTPVTSLGGPLVGAGLAVVNGWTLTTATVLLTVALLALTGPVLGAATGRVAAQQEGLLDEGEPE
jgi:multisubunit Na+/H+ antiporter MnhG subunit